MVGVVSYDGEKWIVTYNDGVEKIVPVYYKNVKSIEATWGKKLVTGVNFELVDEFTHPDLFYGISWGEGSVCAKLIPSTIPTV